MCIRDRAYAEYYEDFIRHTMGLSRAFQRAVLGMGAVAYQLSLIHI